MKNGIKKNYHWVIAVLVFLEMVIFGGLINSASVFTLPISEGLGVSTTSYALLSTAKWRNCLPLTKKISCFNSS